MSLTRLQTQWFQDPTIVRRRGGHKTLVEILLKARVMPDFGLPNLAYSHVPYLAPA